MPIEKRETEEFRFIGKVILLATGNIHKFQEARKVLAEYKIAAGMIKIKGLEVQSDNLGEIARSSVTDAFDKCHLPLIVEDAGLFVDALNGFPGPYAAYVFRTIGNHGLLRLMTGVKNREAKFESAIAYFASDYKNPICFRGEVAGQITTRERRGKEKMSFGFDPVFMPDGCKATFAEMKVEEKNQFSHRAKALRSFAVWYKKERTR